MRLSVRFAVLGGLCAFLAGCTVGGSAVFETLAAVRGNGGQIDKATLRPDVQYLRIWLGRSQALFALGFVDATPEGQTLVFYGSSGEVIRLTNGRITGALGLPVEWRSVQERGELTWPVIGVPAHYRRLVDVMPGYRVGVPDEVTVTRLEAPPSNRLARLDAAQLAWYSETGLNSGLVALDPRTQAPVYGEQCLDRSTCLAWQMWPPKPEQGSRTGAPS